MKTKSPQQDMEVHVEPDIPVEAFSFKQHLREKANTRKQNTLDAVWNVLLLMKRQGIKVFSIAKVGEALEKAGVLKTQSLRNATGKDYRDLIEAFAADVGGVTTHSTAVVSTPIEDAIRQLGDIDARTRLSLILSENTRQREEINRLKEAFRHLQLKHVPTYSQNITSTEASAIAAVRPKIDVRAIERFLSGDWLDERRWVIQANSSIKDEDGYLVAPAGFVDTLRKLIA